MTARVRHSVAAVTSQALGCRPAISILKKLALLFALSILVTSAWASQEESKEKATPVLADRHISLGLKCSACHGEVAEKKDVTTDQCLNCHRSYEEVAKKLRTRSSTRILITSSRMERLVRSAIMVISLQRCFAAVAT
jgi:hypothetical protein